LAASGVRHVGLLLTRYYRTSSSSYQSRRSVEHAHLAAAADGRRTLKPERYSSLFVQNLVSDKIFKNHFSAEIHSRGNVLVTSGIKSWNF